MLPANDNAPQPTPLRHEREPFLPLAFAVLGAPLLWALHFAIVFLLEGFLCVPVERWTAWIPAAIVAATLLCGGVCLWSLLAREAWPRRTRAALLQSYGFANAIRRVLAGLSLAGILWAGAGVMLIAPCMYMY